MYSATNIFTIYEYLHFTNNFRIYDHFFSISLTIQNLRVSQNCFVAFSMLRNLWDLRISLGVFLALESLVYISFEEFPIKHTLCKKFLKLPLPPHQIYIVLLLTTLK